MTAPSSGTGAAAATEQDLRSAIVEIGQALETGETDRLARWCVDGCTTWAGAAAAGLVELTRADRLDQWVVTATRAPVQGLIERDLRLAAGPCRFCLASAQPATITDLATPGKRWADFAAGARQQGFTWTRAQPLRLDGELVGALQLFGVGSLPADEDLQLSDALAKLALAQRVQQQVLHFRDTEVEQLHTALDTRLVIEQAKGILAARYGVDLAEAFARLRKYARDHRISIHDLARDVVRGQAPDLS